VVGYDQLEEACHSILHRLSEDSRGGRHVGAGVDLGMGSRIEAYVSIYGNKELTSEEKREYSIPPRATA